VGNLKDFMALPERVIPVHVVISNLKILGDSGNRRSGLLLQLNLLKNSSIRIFIIKRNLINRENSCRQTVLAIKKIFDYICKKERKKYGIIGCN